jgi:hypothetical protein
VEWKGSKFVESEAVNPWTWLQLRCLDAGIFRVLGIYGFNCAGSNEGLAGDGGLGMIWHEIATWVQ